MKINLPKIILAALLVAFMASPALGGLEEDLLRYRAEQDRLQRLIDQTKKEANTLSAQISILDNEIKLTQLEIGATQAELNIKEAELAALSTDIGELADRIGNLETDLRSVATIATKRFRMAQAVQNAAPFGAVFVSGDFESVSANMAYLEYVQQHDQKIFDEMRIIKNALAVQKGTLQDKQAEVQKIRDSIQRHRDELAAAKAKLDSQKNEKAYLLRVTKNNEATYQRLLEQVRSEINSIQIALMGGGVRLGTVKAGDTIAKQGNTGCSTGSHLHFGSYQNGVAYNPKPQLDSGYFRWPEYTPQVTQWYGANYSWYMKYFGMPGHNGIDMISGGWPNGGSGSPILASRAGTAYLSVESNPCSFTGTRGKGIVIDHGLGLKTIYWHIQ